MKDLFNFLDSNKQSGGKPVAAEGIPGTLVDSSTGSPGINKQQAALAEGKYYILK
jgi:hypothetical protein